MPDFQQAVLLREHHRYEEAIQEFLGVLAQDPDFADAHAQLALTYYQMPGRSMSEKALDSIDRAIQCEADESYYHAVKAMVLSDLDQDRKALKAAEAAIALNPGPMEWSAKGQALTGLQRWADAEAAFDVVLAMDPDSDMAQNMRTICLRMQNKLDETEAASHSRLERDAEDPMAFANSGWGALQRGNREEAETMFREALRLDPGNEYARRGLLEAFKARSPLYRVYHKWCFFMQRFTEGKQWLIIIGLYLIFRFGRTLAEKVSPLLAGGLVFVYLVFALWTFVAPGLGHFLILLDKRARFSLRSYEKWDGLLVGGLLVAGILLACVGLVVNTGLAIAGAFLALSTVPFAMVFRNRILVGRLLFTGVGALAVVTALLILFATVFSVSSDTQQLIKSMVSISALAIMLTTWGANLPILNRPRVE